MGKIHRLWLTVNQTALKLRDQIYPPACVGCQADGSRWCQDCRASITYISPPWCNTCGYPMPNTSTEPCWACSRSITQVSRLRSALLYGPELASIIHAFKYKYDQTLVNELGLIMTQRWRESPPANTCVIPVPLNATRQRERGFNQALLLARYFAWTFELDLVTHALERIRDTKQQAKLNLAERKTNVAGAFVVTKPEQINNRTVILIDDVCTTGATLDACAKALHQAGATDVWAYTLARASHKNNNI